MDFSEYVQVSFAENPDIQIEIENEILAEYGMFGHVDVEGEINIEKYDADTKEMIITGTFIAQPPDKAELDIENYGTFKARVKFIGKGKEWADFEHIETFDLTTDFFD